METGSPSDRRKDKFQAGEKATINLSANASGIVDADTYAEVTVTSNSVGQSTAKVLVNLHLNQAPQFGDSA